MEFNPLNSISYEQFQKFIDSLDEEKNTWSLDLQRFKNNVDYFNYQSDADNIVLLDGDEVVGLFLATPERPAYQKLPPHITQLVGDNSFKDVEYYIMSWIYSYVIKKEYQKQNLATAGLRESMKLKFEQTNGEVVDGEQTYNINLLIHAARTHTYNLGSRFLLKKLGFSSVHKHGEQVIYVKIADLDNKNFLNIKSAYDSDLIRDKNEIK